MSTATVDDLRVLERLIEGLSPEKRKALERLPEIKSRLGRWQPNPGPQQQAYESKADCLLYGGQPGGGKTSLELGLAFNEHKRSFIMRREYGDLERIIEDALKIHGGRDGYNGSPPPRLRTKDGRLIYFRAAHRVGDEQGTMGQGRDLLCVGPETPVLMSDGRYKAMSDIRTGDMVWTLGGGRRVTKVFPKQRKEAVRLSVFGADGKIIFSQVQSSQHRVLTRKANAESAFPHKTAATRPCESSSAMGNRACDRLPLSFACSFGQSWRIREWISGCFQSVCEALRPALRLHFLHWLEICAYAGPRGLGNDCAASYGECQEQRRRSLSSGRQEHRQPRCGSNGDMRELLHCVCLRDSDGALAQSLFGDFLDRYSVDFHPYDEPLLFRPTFCSDAKDVQLYLLQLNDAEQPSPIGWRGGVEAHTPKYSGRAALYHHPYTKDAYYTHQTLQAFAYDVCPVGTCDLYDIEVDELNHYVTGGGVVNSNCLDEATQFAESQVRFLMGWVRSEDPNQRCRTVMATNPPLQAEGLWVVRMFAPWLDERYPRPAMPGELRWVISDADGKDEWVSGPDDVREVNGKIVRPTSRTYIPSSVRDNPYYVDSDYERQLDAMPEPFRSLLMGGFKTQFRDDDNQLIPTAWIKAAQARWKPDGWREHEMTAMALDPAGGGADAAVLAWRHGGWYAPLVALKADDAKPGEDRNAAAERALRRASAMAAGVIVHRRANAPVIIDMGGGYGGDVMSRLKENGVPYLAFNGANRSTAIAADGRRFVNARAEAWWKFRDELNPDREGGSVVALPDDPELLADLATPAFEVRTNGILVESKEEIKKRLGRSPDKGDAVVMCLAPGNTAVKRSINQGHRVPKVILAYANAKGRFR